MSRSSLVPGLSVGVPLPLLVGLMLAIAPITLAEPSQPLSPHTVMLATPTSSASYVDPLMTDANTDAATSSAFLPCAFRSYDPSVCYDQQTGDLSAPGSPLVGIYRPPEMTYPAQGFDVYTKEMHGRVVTVAIEKGFDLHEDATGELWKAQELADFVFDLWALFWHEYQGFPWSSYTVVFGQDLPYADAGAYALGHQSAHFRTPWIAHEIYHAWNGADFRQAGERSWYMEGVTTYYGDLRHTTETSFDGIARQFYGLYLDYYNSGQDRALADLSMNDPDYNHPFVAQKGALVAYLLDLELAKTGHHLGEVSRLLYERYGMGTWGRPTNEEILAIFNEVSGADFRDFFDRYIYGAERLPLTEDTTFGWVCHD